MDPIYAFVFAGLFSPGPNVILLTASGARFGFQRTLPHVFGVAFGVGIIAALAGLGVASLLRAEPVLTFGLKIVAAAWILWMAWKLWNADLSQTNHSEAERPFTFLQAVLFQWVNPKLWAVALAAAVGYSAGLSPVGEAQRLALVFAGINLFVCLFWSYAGSLLAYLLTSPFAASIFTKTMALALAISAVMVFA